MQQIDEAKFQVYTEGIPEALSEESFKVKSVYSIRSRSRVAQSLSFGWAEAGTKEILQK